MKMLTLGMTLLTLAFGAASAQASTDTDTETSTETGGALSSLAGLVASGATVTLVDADGQIVATVAADGTLTLADGAQLGSATGVSVKSGDHSTTYALATQATKRGMLFVSQTNAQGKTLTLPLIAAINRDAAAAKRQQNAAASAKPSIASTAGRPDKASTPEVTGKPDPAGRPETTGAGAGANGLTNVSATNGAKHAQTGIAAATSGAGNAKVPAQQPPVGVPAPKGPKGHKH